MKITKAKFRSSNQNVTGVRSGIAQVAIGDPCDVAWGGGNITSLDYDRSCNSLAIRKGSRFERANQSERKDWPSFDVVLVPWDNVDNACGVDGAETETIEVATARAKSAEEAAARLTAERDELAKQVEQLTAPQIKQGQGGQPRGK